MSAGATLAATGLGLVALGWLTSSDPKRRRAFGRPPAARPAPKPLVWGTVLVCGVLAAWLSGPAGFVIWLGATSAIGWAMIALPPDRGPERVPPAVRRAGRWLARAARRARALLARVGIRGRDLSGEAPLEERITALEAELAELRAELARRRAEPEAVLLDLAGHRRQATEH